MVTAAYLPFLMRSQLAWLRREQNQMSFETLQSHSSHYSWSHIKKKKTNLLHLVSHTLIPSAFVLLLLQQSSHFSTSSKQGWLHNL